MGNINNKILVIIFLMFTEITFCQIDTTEYYPLQKNNYWEYWGYQTFILGKIKMTKEVKGDTLLENNKTYKIIQRNIYSDSINIQTTDYSYLRIDSNKIYMYTGASQSCDLPEYIYYDFNKPDGSIWEICPTFYTNYRGVHSSKIFYIPLADIITPVRIFDYVTVSNIDTVWAPMDAPTTEYIAKGIGLISEMDWDFAFFELYGMIINGKVYGQITSINERENFVNEFELYQNYPNPFNPNTKIKFSIPRSDKVTIKLFDILGREINTLLNEYKNAGTYEIIFNGTGLNSGIYFYRINAGTYSNTKKMILLK